MIAIIVPLYNILAVITLEIFRGGKICFAKVLASILKNPLILGSVAGIALVALEIKLPLIFEETISSISSAATPMALIVLGASFRMSSIKESKRNLIICVIGRLIVVPGLFLTAATLLGFRGVAFLTLVGVFSAPCAVSSFTMAQQMNSDYKLAANTVMFTSALSSFTIFMWIFLFKQLGMF